MTLSKKITQLVVNDYFTPSIKAEVILDALLTRYVAEIIEEQFRDGSCFQGTLRFVTKEISVRDLEKPLKNASYGNMGTKIDYILGDEQMFCLVKDAFSATYEKQFLDQFGAEPSAWNDETLEAAFQMVFDSAYLGKKYGVSMLSPDDDAPTKTPIKKEDWMQSGGNRYAEAAKALIKKAGWAQSDSARSRKYLYTMGQLLDYRATIGRQQELAKDTLWNRPLKLTPSGSLPYADYLDSEFYLHPKGTGNVSPTEEGTGSVSLTRAGKYLAKKPTMIWPGCWRTS